MSRTSWSGGFRVEIRPRNWQENDGKAGKRTYRTVLVAIPIGTLSEVSFETTKRNGPVRWHKESRTVFRDVENQRQIKKPIRYMH